ncbi:MAG: TetR/AcrR family transcriptional regulator [Pseudomonadota bacterium]|nr:TetR/AcrR family transcriptional regulator [Pseudomonadota bacterium]
MATIKQAAVRTRVRTRLTRDEGKAQRARELLDAAWAVFCEVGYEKLTIEDVADRAGYSRQPVYTLFGDKQNLFCELQIRATVAVMDLLFTHLQPTASLRDNLGRVAQIVAEQLNSNKPPHGDRLYVVAQTIAFSRPDIAARLQTQARWVIDQIARLIRRSGLADDEALRSTPEVIAAHLAAHINGLTAVQLQTGMRYATVEDLTEIFRFFAFERR